MLFQVSPHNLYVDQRNGPNAFFASIRDSNQLANVATAITKHFVIECIYLLRYKWGNTLLWLSVTADHTVTPSNLVTRIFVIMFCTVHRTSLVTKCYEFQPYPVEIDGLARCTIYILVVYFYSFMLAWA